MTTLTLRCSGDADPDEVWDRYLHLARWPQWSPQISRVRTDAATLHAGQRGTVIGLLGVRVPFVVEAVDEVGRNWSWQVSIGPVRLKLHHAVYPAPGGASTSLRIQGPAPMVFGYAPLARLALGRLVRA